MLCEICGKDYKGDRCPDCSPNDILAYVEARDREERLKKVKKSTPKKPKPKKKAK